MLLPDPESDIPVSRSGTRATTANSSRGGPGGLRGNGDGLFAGSVGIAVDASGNIHLTDQFRVQVFDREGVFLHKWGSAGTGDGRFQRPIGVAIDTSGNVCVVDMGNDRVRVFNVELAE